MATTTSTPRDEDLQTDVMDELDWTPDVDPAHIGVSVDEGVVTLSGHVSSASERTAAKEATFRVRGVTAVVDDLDVHVPGSPLSDAVIAEAAHDALRWSAVVPSEAVKVEVRDHVVTLNGTVDWNYQREAARKAIEKIIGVKHVENKLKLIERPSVSETKDHITKAFIRNASLDANNIEVTVEGNTVTLGGWVASWAEKKQAENAAWSSPHVLQVKNTINIRPL